MTGRSVAGAGSGGRLCFASLPPRRRSTVAGSRPGALCSPRPPLPEGEEATRPRAGGARDLTPAQAKAITHPPARGEARCVSGAPPRTVAAPARARGSAEHHHPHHHHHPRTRPRAGKRDAAPGPSRHYVPHPPARGGSAPGTEPPAAWCGHPPARGGRGGHGIRRGAHIHELAPPRARGGPTSCVFAGLTPKRTPPRAGGGATSGSVATVAAFRLTQVGGRLTRFHGGR